MNKMKCHSILLIAGILLAVSASWRCAVVVVAFQITAPLSFSKRTIPLYYNHRTPPQLALGHPVSKAIAAVTNAAPGVVRPFTCRKAPSPTASTSLHLFDDTNNGNGLGGGGRAQKWKEVLQRLKLVAVVITNQFTSGYLTGYVFSVIWGVLRGRATQRALWGFEFGAISAIFGGWTVAAKELFNAEEDSVWSVTIRNIALSFYFGRNLGWFAMLRNAAIYGGLTYYFVSQKVQRDLARGPMSPAPMAELMQQLMDMNKNGGAGGDGVAGSPVDMAELLQRMSGTTNNDDTMSSPSKTTNPANKKESSPLDVEWERVETDGTDDDDDGVKKI